VHRKTKPPMLFFSIGGIHFCVSCAFLRLTI
jgi:hypothetical protein